MPFELTHLAVGIRVRLQRLTPSYLAGLIYPDIRYPTKIDRRLTHSLEPYAKCTDLEFIAGVQCHLETDKVWDVLIQDLQLQPPDPSMPMAAFIGSLKLVHDRIAYTDLQDITAISSKLNEFILPDGLPVTRNQWKVWVTALKRYVKEGPTIKGWMEIVTSMNFQSAEELIPRLKMVELMYSRLEPVFVEIHKNLVQRVGRMNA